MNPYPITPSSSIMLAGLGYILTILLMVIGSAIDEIKHKKKN